VIKVQLVLVGIKDLRVIHLRVLKDLQELKILVLRGL
jgi:hypothetical protein